MLLTCPFCVKQKNPSCGVCGGTGEYTVHGYDAPTSVPQPVPTAKPERVHKVLGFRLC